MGIRGRDKVEIIIVGGIRKFIFVFSNCHFILFMLEDGNNVSDVE